MKKTMLLVAYASCVLLFASCKEDEKKETAAATVTEPAKPDLAKIRAEIVGIETAWAAAINAKDSKTLMAMYGDDAVSMPDGEPIDRKSVV